MEKPVDYVKPNLWRRLIDSTSSPTFEFKESIMHIQQYYNRGRYRFVYFIEGNRVIKIFRCIYYPNEYLGSFYQEAKKQVEISQTTTQDSMSLLERLTYASSLVLNYVEEIAYKDIKGLLPKRIVDTEFGIGKKSRFGKKIFRPYTIQPFVKGIPLSSIVKGEKPIREKMMDHSLESLNGYILDFGKVEKAEVLKGVEEFLGIFDKFYQEQEAVIDLRLHNLVFTDKGLVCYDIQKAHKSDVDFGFFAKDASDRDVFHILKGVLEGNQ